MSFKTIEPAPARLNRSELAVPGSQPSSLGSLSSVGARPPLPPGYSSSLPVSPAGPLSGALANLGSASRGRGGRDSVPNATPLIMKKLLGKPRGAEA